MRTIPPYAQLLRLRFEEGQQGHLTILPFHDDVVGAPAHLHGGAIAGLLEFAAFGALARAVDDERVAMKPITVTVDYMRPGLARDTFAAATVERLGGRIANVVAFAWQTERSKPIASARVNFLLRRPDQ